MTLKAQLTEDMKTAMKAGEKDRLGVIRLINAAIKQKEVDERIEMTDELVLAVLEKMLKQRKDSISQYEAAGRTDLADIEKFESGIIQAYLPQPLSQAEVEALVAQQGLDQLGHAFKGMGQHSERRFVVGKKLVAQIVVARVIGGGAKGQLQHAARTRAGHGPVMRQRQRRPATVDAHFVRSGAQVGGAVDQCAVQVKQHRLDGARRLHALVGGLRQATM